MKRPLLVLTAILWVLAPAVKANAEPRLPLELKSTNWAGYDVTRRPPDRRFHSVSAHWVEPMLDCSLSVGVTVPGGKPEGVGSYAAFWVGLDGDGSRTVEQIGTSANCDGLEADHEAWWEMYPGYPAELELEIRPGDEIAASVTFIGGARFALSLEDVTSGQEVRVVRRLRHAARVSAEAITEAPYSTFNGVLPLSPFGEVEFSSVRFDGKDPSLFGMLQRIHMTDPDGKTIIRAETSGLADGSFRVEWKSL